MNARNLSNALDDARRARPWLVAPLAVLVLAGCTLLSPSRNQLPELFALSPAIEAARAERAPAEAPTLLVNVPRAGPGFDSPRMAYVLEPHALAYFARHQWVDTPARMLVPLLVRAFEGTGRFAAVVSAPSSVATRLRVDTEVVRLVQDFSVRPSVLRFTVRAQIVDTDQRRVLATREITRAVEAPSDDPVGGVAAANEAVGTALGELAATCAALAAP